MALSPDEIETLERLGLDFRVQDENGMTCVTIRDFRLPGGFKLAMSTLLIRLNPGFPDVPPDMWWFDPPVMRIDSAVIPATDAVEHHLGHSWQRWSRHLDPGQWQSGIDSLESFIAIIRRELVQWAPEAVPCV